MKKKLTALLLALALVYTFSLPVAAAQKTVEWEGVTYTVDTEAQTIHDGESEYEYQVELYRDGYTLEITYPNGAFWSASVTDSDGTYGWNEEYDMKGTVYPTGIRWKLYCATRVSPIFLKAAKKASSCCWCCLA